MSKTNRLSAQFCPVCFHAIDAASSFSHEQAPEPGDLTVCLYCSAVLEIDKRMRQRRASPEALAALDPQVAAEIRRFQAAVLLLVRGRARSSADEPPST